MFRTRLISGIVLVAAALLTIISGNWILYFTILALALIGTFEFYRALGVHKTDPEHPGFHLNLLEAAGYICVILYYLSLVLYWGVYQLAMLILSLVILMAIYVFTYPKYHSSDVLAAYFGIIYVGVMLSFVYQTRMLEGGKYIVWLIFLSSWGCDTCAYCVGMLFGKRKMAPILSPKKSVEGAVGGVVGAMLLGFLYALLTKGPVLEYVLICGFGSLVSMIGDLAASAVKRNAGIKDYGKLIPGHGGVLDRFDSVIFTAPIIYYLAVTII